IFFFQAEDGIRDDLVTGVQTCALPIFSWTDTTVMVQVKARIIEQLTKLVQLTPVKIGRIIVEILRGAINTGLPVIITLTCYWIRSEERRVGKACRDR